MSDTLEENVTYRENPPGTKLMASGCAYENHPSLKDAIVIFSRMEECLSRLIFWDKVLAEINSALVVERNEAYMRGMYDEHNKSFGDGQNPYVAIAMIKSTSILAGALTQLRPVGNLGDRLREYAFFRQEQATTAADAFLVSDLLDASNKLKQIKE